MSDATAPQPRLPGLLTAVGLAGLTALFVVWVVYEPYLNHDVAQYLTAAQMLVDGAVPYVDFVDTNPPMIVYLSALPALWASLTGMRLATAGLLFFVAIVFATGGLFALLLRRIEPDLERWELGFVGSAWIGAALWVYRSGEFGQRDQILALTVAPFLLLRHARYRTLPVPVAWAVASAVAASLGLALKPHLLAGVAVFEIAHLLRFRHMRQLRAPELWICSALALAYALHFLLVPGMSAFYAHWLGFVARGYDAYGVGAAAVLALMLRSPLIWIHTVLALSLLALLPWRRSSLCFLATGFGAFALVGMALFAFQGKAWLYHVIPFELANLLGATLALLAARRAFPRVQPWVLAGLCIVGLGIAHPAPLRLASRAASAPAFSFADNPLTRAIERWSGPNEAVLFLDTSVVPAFPALTYTGRPAGGRFLCTWPLAFFFHDSSGYAPRPQWERDEEEFYRGLLEDVETRRPRLIFVSTLQPAQATAPYFRISEYLRRRGFFDAIDGYRPVRNVWGFQILVRD